MIFFHEKFQIFSMKNDKTKKSEHCRSFYCYIIDRGYRCCFDFRRFDFRRQGED